MNNDLRTEKQNEAIAVLQRDKRLILEWGTGVGKTRVAVHAINNLLLANPAARILLAVQERAHKNNWKKEFMDVLGELRGILVYDSITVDCYASLKNHEGTCWNLFVADEGHHLRGDNKISLLWTICSDSVLFLSARRTGGAGDGVADVRILLEDHVDERGLAAARRRGHHDEERFRFHVGVLNLKNVL